ncbi:MAG TPA: carbohydrate binding family 9 domain-containing protein, partial [Thermoanaerobaculia bacterium]
MRRALFLLVTFATASLFAAGPTIQISRAAGPIKVDGDLSDPGWKGATRVDQWYETNPGDNVEPKVKSVGYLTYDDRAFYAGFEFFDPEPSKIRGPFNDRDHIGGNTDDYGGVILDTRNDGKTAILFLVNPRNIQYDAVSDDTTGNEDQSPDFFWDSATKITSTGWTLEIRIPFSTLRYSGAAPKWGIMLYRNW